MKDAQALLRHKKEFDRYVDQREYQLSPYHFSSIFLWQDFFEFDFEVIDDYLCVFAEHILGTFLYLPPLGKKLNEKIIARSFNRLNALNSKRSFSRIENVSGQELALFDPKKYRSTEKSKEYCYLKKDIAELKGNAYKSKRSSYNQFAARYDHEYAAFDQKWTNDCLRLYDAWAKNRADNSDDEIYKAMLEENRQVHELIFQYYDELGLEGRVVLMEGKPQGYSFGYPLNDKTFCVLVEVTNLDAKGLSVYIFSRFCADPAIKKIEFINAMDDFAMANVAKTKASFKPNILIPSFVITER
jgi:hypothetical protein